MRSDTSQDGVRGVQLPAFASIPGLSHGFEQRLGPDGWESQEATRRRVAAALEGDGRLLLLRQVHGRAVVRAPWDGRPEGDAGLAETAGLLLGVETADCLPVLLVDPRRRAVAVAHAGWRGSALGVTRAAVLALVERGSRAQDLMVALGPAIGPCCYEVGDELRDHFGPQGQAFFQPGPRGRPHLDVRAANRGQLLEAGVPASRIHSLDDCTCCRADLYHSYRREGRGSGRMISYVGFRA